MQIYGVDGYIGSMLGHIEAPDTILWFGGPSSVKWANRDPGFTWESVCNFKRLLDRLQPHERLIYASSCSIYDAVEGMQDETCATFHLKNWYDFAKRTMDSLALLSGKRVYGLRLATVNGWSPVLRTDVMMNKMVADAKNLGKVTVTNPQMTRPVLGIQDLVRAVEAICASTEDKRGIYNLASFAESVESYGRRVAETCRVPLEVLDGDPSYVYDVDTSKFQKAFDFTFKETPETVLQSLEQPWQKTVERV